MFPPAVFIFERMKNCWKIVKMVKKKFDKKLKFLKWLQTPAEIELQTHVQKSEQILK